MVLLRKAGEVSEANGISDHIEVKIVQALKARFTKKVTKIVPLGAPTAKPPTKIPPPPPPISY